MPFNLDFSSSRNALARFQQFAQYDMMNRRASERAQKQAILESALATELTREKFGQDIQLEAFKSQTAQREETNKAILQVLQMPEFDGAVSILNMARAGKLGPEQEPLVTRARELMENAYTTLGDAFYQVQTGKAGPEHLANIVKYFGTKAMDYSKELGISLRAIEQNKVDQEANRIKNITAEREALNYPDWLKNQVTSIKDASDFVSSQGQDPDEGMKSTMIDLLGGAGLKKLATLPGEIQGKVLQGLEEIKQRITVPGRERPMTAAEAKFVAEAKNAFKIRKSPTGEAAIQGGGLLDYKTGERGTDEAVYNEDAKRAKVAVLKKKMMDAFHRPVTTQEYEQYKVLAERLKSGGQLTPEEKAAYNQLEMRLWYKPDEEEDAFYLGLAIEYYNDHFLSPGEQPLPLPAGYTPQKEDADGLIRK